MLRKFVIQRNLANFYQIRSVDLIDDHVVVGQQSWGDQHVIPTTADNYFYQNMFDLLQTVDYEWWYVDRTHLPWQEELEWSSEDDITIEHHIPEAPRVSRVPATEPAITPAVPEVESAMTQYMNFRSSISQMTTQIQAGAPTFTYADPGLPYEARKTAKSNKPPRVHQDW